MKPWLKLSYRFYRKLTSKRDKPAPVRGFSPFMEKSVLTMAPRPLAVSRKGLTTVILTLTAKENVTM